VANTCTFRSIDSYCMRIKVLPTCCVVSGTLSCSGRFPWLWAGRWTHWLGSPAAAAAASCVYSSAAGRGSGCVVPDLSPPPPLCLPALPQLGSGRLQADLLWSSLVPSRLTAEKRSSQRVLTPHSGGLSRQGYF